MRIEVTIEDIANGKPRDPGGCAVACALRRANLNCHSIGGVFNAQGPVAWMLGDGPRKLKLPPEVGLWARRFDAEEHVEPFAFDIAWT